ncbi:hypothetical protein Tco_1392322 [Tanacetum coccineum]
MRIAPRFSKDQYGKNIGEGCVKWDLMTMLVGRFQNHDSFGEMNVFMSMNVDNALFGRVKVFDSPSNLKMALGNEGFSIIVIKYWGTMGYVWNSITGINEKFKKCVSVMSWFSGYNRATNEFEVMVGLRGRSEGVLSSYGQNIHLLDLLKSGENCSMWLIRMRLVLFLRTLLGPEFTGCEYESEDDNSMDEEGEVKKNGIKDEHSDGEIVPESLFEDGELENNHVDGIFFVKMERSSRKTHLIYLLYLASDLLDDKDTNLIDSLMHPPGLHL